MTYPRNQIVVKKPGGFKALVYDETPIDDPSPGEVRVEVKACGINFADTVVRKGLYAAARGKYPICPGLEFSVVLENNCLLFFDTVFYQTCQFVEITIG